MIYIYFFLYHIIYVIYIYIYIYLKGYAPCRRPPLRLANCWTAWQAGFAELAGFENLLLHCKNRCDFRSEMCSVDVFQLIFHPGDSFLGPQVIIFAIQGSPGPAKRIHKDPGFDFHRFLTDLGTLFRTCFGAGGSFFRVLRDTSSSIGFQVAF